MEEGCPNDMSKRREYKTVHTVLVKFLLLIFILLNTAETAFGGCRMIYVSGAMNNQDGYYHDYSYCNGYQTWTKNIYNVYPNYYISYRNTTYSNSYSWTIVAPDRLTSCSDGIIYSINPNSGGYSRPYDLPNYWHELTGNEFRENRYLTVSVRCVEDDLNGEETVATVILVIGSITGALCCLGFAIAICMHIMQKKQQRAAASSTPTNTYPETAPLAYNSGGVVTITTVNGTQPVPEYNPHYPPAPPYSNAAPYPVPPPAYIQYDNTGVNNQGYSNQ